MLGVSLTVATHPALAGVQGLAHGFERRRPEASHETREEGRARLSRALEGQGKLLLLKQVHGATVVEAPWEGTPEADAAVAVEPGWLLGVETADCLPILLVDPHRRRVAVAHAGWRGTAAGVARCAVEALVARGSRPDGLVAVLGPGIGPCCYEVGEEVRSAFGPDGAGLFMAGPRGRARLDLRAANVRQMVGVGVAESHIHHIDECTACHPELYHSYRRDGRGGGRMISFAGFV
jgi:YfiH family protein